MYAQLMFFFTCHAQFHENLSIIPQIHCPTSTKMQFRFFFFSLRLSSSRRIIHTCHEKNRHISQNMKRIFSAREVWDSLQIPLICMTFTFYIADTPSCVKSDYQFKHSLTNYWATIFPIVCWNIWLNRNQRNNNIGRKRPGVSL